MMMDSEPPPSIPILAMINIFGGLIFGYDTGIIATASLPIRKHFLGPKNEDKSLYSALLTASILLGAMIGSLVGGALSDFIGRKKTMLLMGFVSTIGPIICSVVYLESFAGFYLLCVLRIVLGFGVGLSSVICPLYVNEMSPKEIKGRLGTLFQLSITIGILLSYAIGYLLLPSSIITGRYHLDNSASWRLQIAVGLLPGFNIIILSGTNLMRESTEWKKKRELPVSGDTYKPLVEGPTRLISSENIGPLISGIILALTLQFTGINAVMYYATSILQTSFPNAKSQSLSYYLTIIVGAWNFVATGIAVAVSDKFHRKTLLLFGLILIIAGDGVLGICYLAKDKNNVSTSPDATGIVSVIALIVFIAGFEIGPGALFWVLLSDIFAPGVRESANGFINFLQWGCNLVLSIVFPFLAKPNISKGQQAAPFFFFSALGVISFFYNLKFLKLTYENSRRESVQ
eukprot:TRINITY_DN755_c0_g2_i2.p1 TRINITY_DN755_c0_g2~~TRINITY_DN755_c0_g2_i2.p1  ORF type:complete len:459 (-),score=32.20 TRINITY_DN755_c0_g2_i2:12-1388(-)